MPNKLKSCPFCGGEAVLYHQSSKYTDKDGNYVHCMKCGARTKLFECFNGTGKTHTDSKKEAIEAWEKRADNESEYLETIEALKMEIAGMEGALRMIGITGGLEVTHRAIEKQIPKKPLLQTYHSRFFECPACSHLISDAMTYCPHCGQALDWE